MQILQQIESVSIARAANAAHYEYLATVRKRTEEIQLDHDLWHRAGGAGPQQTPVGNRSSTNNI